MHRRLRVATMSGLVAAAVLVIHADGPLSSQTAEIELRVARLLFAQGQYPEAQ